MRHHNKVKKFGREKNQRVALMQSLARSLILLGRIETSEAKAKALRPYVEKLVTKARDITLPKHRQILATLRNRNFSSGWHDAKRENESRYDAIRRNAKTVWGNDEE